MWGRRREGEIPPLITSWVTAPAGRCQNPTLSDVRRVPENGGGERGSRKRARGKGERNDNRKRDEIPKKRGLGGDKIVHWRESYKI